MSSTKAWFDFYLLHIIRRHDQKNMGRGLTSLWKVDIKTNYQVHFVILFYLLSVTATQSEHILVCSYEPQV